jgi:hypothetical protein
MASSNSETLLAQIRDALLTIMEHANPFSPESLPTPGFHVGGDLHVHTEKPTAADAEKLIHDLRRAVRSTGHSTGAAGPESKGVHGFPIR